MSQFRQILGKSTSLKTNKTYIPTEYNIDPGNDILAYDKENFMYVGIVGSSYDPTVPGFSDRYDTNNDIIVGISDDYIHACACNSIDSVYGNTAASHCFYKLTLPASVINGSKSFDMNTGNVTRTFTGTVDTIVSKMQDTSNATVGGFGAENYNNYLGWIFVEKIDETTIGIGRGDVIVNRNNVTITFDGSSFLNNGSYNGLTLEDMTLKCTADTGIQYGDDYSDSYTQYSSTTHKDFRGQSCTTSGYTSPDISTALGPSNQCYSNNGQFYRCVGANYNNYFNYYKDKNNGFRSDGVNGSSITSQYIMGQNIFDSCVNASATGDAKKMYDYYNELLTSTDPSIKEKREKLESMYGSMQSFTDSPLYAAYVMSHMIDVNSDNGVTAVFRNQGKYLTDIKGRVMNVDYNDKYVPVYPPEYSALQYGNNDSNSHFKKGSYYLPELFDLGLILRDDIVTKFNTYLNVLHNKLNILISNINIRSNFFGTCSEHDFNTTWFYNMTFSYFNSTSRNSTVFNIRPFFACANNESYIPTASNINPGNDILAYDKIRQKYVGIKGDTYNPNIPGFSDRYDTNNDIIIGVTDGYIHACSCKNVDSVYGDSGASHCFYKLTLPVDVLNGTKSFDLYLGRTTRTFTGSVDSIVSKMRDSSNATAGGLNMGSSNTYTNVMFVEKLSDSIIGMGVGAAAALNNVITITYDGSSFSYNGSYNGLTLEDMTLKCTADTGIQYGDDYSDSYTQYSNTTHKDFRTQSCTTSGYTSPDISTAFIPLSNCYCNNGQNYSRCVGVVYNTFINFEKNYASGNSFVSDGVNNSTNQALNAANIMNLSTFDSCVNASATGDAKKMYDYYNELLTGTDPSLKAKREKLESMYGSMQAFTDSPLYAAYVMSHMIDVNNDTSNGITQVYRNQGKYITDIKGRVMNVDYNDKYVPAYPPEYSALQYGNNNPESHFKKGSYYHPEPYDLGSALRDDILNKLNTRLNTLHNNFNITVDLLLNNTLLGICTEYTAATTWYFINSSNIYTYRNRYLGSFYSRPFFACSNS